MHVVETQATVTPDRELVVRVQLPADMAPGPHRVVVVVEESPQMQPPTGPLNLPLLQADSWPADLSLRREDMYGDWGR